MRNSLLDGSMGKRDWSDDAMLRASHMPERAHTRSSQFVTTASLRIRRMPEDIPECSVAPAKKDNAITEGENHVYIRIWEKDLQDGRAGIIGTESRFQRNWEIMHCFMYSSLISDCSDRVGTNLNTVGLKISKDEDSEQGEMQQRFVIMTDADFRGR
jgi:hypothetical protein